ncbi:DNA polymerase ligase N-terminal domain-containing protein [Nakamurella deserti]|uniref:DNA polymerase ligase N-terminal domain-containing protein n=1 Tax=Nakamurella deserti TaxID=2164074 RepID=UPI00197C662F|nr:DNA polymerase ligase N-terminal domain-containing protein [Nakamurella deserti]
MTDPEESHGPGRPDRAAFVLHDHRTPRPHFDLRLEEGGVLRSWAVPRGLPGPDESRLAVAVDDHDLDHLRYTDADKSIADTGWWEEHDRNDRRMVFTLHGREFDVRYVLVHTGGTQWLLRRTRAQPEDGPPD